jgi:hypothetical protein
MSATYAPPAHARDPPTVPPQPPRLSSMAPPVTPPAPLPPAEPPPASAEPIPAQTQPLPPLYKSAQATLVSGSIESVMAPWSWARGTLPSIKSFPTLSLPGANCVLSLTHLPILR